MARETPMAAPRARRSWSQRFWLALGTVSVLAVSVLAVGAGYGTWRFARIGRVDLELSPVASGGPRNYLVVGSDSRQGLSDDADTGAFLNGRSGGRRADTILILRIDPTERRASLLSVPRDLWVTLADTGERHRINAAYNRGPQALADTITAQLGIPVHHYIEVDFAGFQDLVEAIDGVPMYFERAMRDPFSGLKVSHPGCVTLDGPDALAFARARHLEYMRDGEWRSDPTGDLGRITRQQMLIRRAVSRAASEALRDPVTMNRLVDIAVDNVTIDDGLAAGDLADLARRFESFTGRDLTTATLPTRPMTTDAGAEILELDPTGAEALLSAFRDPGSEATSAATPDEGDVALRVLNGSGIEDHAANIAGAMQRAGFAIGEIGNVSSIGGELGEVTEVRYAAGDRALAELVARHLTDGAELTESDAAEEGEPILITGTDLTAVTARAADEVPASSDQRPVDRRGGAGESSSNGDGPWVSRGDAETPPTEPVGRTPGDAPAGVSCG